jgi:hypothetical protein
VEQAGDSAAATCDCGRESTVVVIAEHRPSFAYCDKHARERASELEVSGLDDEELGLIVMVLTGQLRSAWRLTGETR